MNSSYLFAPHSALGALVSAACSQLRLPVQIYDLNLLSKPVCPDSGATTLLVDPVHW